VHLATHAGVDAAVLRSKDAMGVAHRPLEYEHALRAIAYPRILAGERSTRTPIEADRRGNQMIPDYPPSSEPELKRLKTRVEELVLNAAGRLT
jgi:hypothetical protein